MILTPVRTAQEVFNQHGDFIRMHVTPEAQASLRANLPDVEPDHIGTAWFERPPFFVIPNFLHPESLGQLGGLVFERGRCLTAREHHVAGGLIDLMGSLSMHGIGSEIGATDLKVTVKQLANKRDTPPSHQALVLPHQDYASGNAVLFNYDVFGPPQLYQVGEESVALSSNMLVLLRGNYILNIAGVGFPGTEVHAVESSVPRDDPTYEDIARTRILVHASGKYSNYAGDFDPKGSLLGVDVLRMPGHGTY